MEGLTSSQSPGEGSDANMGNFLPLIDAIGIAVLDSATGHIRCPAEHLHTHTTEANHCTLHNNNGILRIHCFHQSCREAIEVYNRVLWKHTSWKAGGGQPSEALRVMSGPHVHGRSTAPQPQKAAPVLDKILQAFPWSYQDIVNDTMGRVTDPEPWHYILLFSLFPPDDILWVADSVHHSGYPVFARNFRRAHDWRGEAQCPGAYICPNAFKPDVISRCNANVVQKRFLVVESDTLTKDDVGAVFRYLMSLGYQLKAVVDTAGKSLHGWLVHPGDAETKRLSRELPKLGCDPQMFSVSQPVRLPGAVRSNGTGKNHYQKLIYFNPQA